MKLISDKLTLCIVLIIVFFFIYMIKESLITSNDKNSLLNLCCSIDQKFVGSDDITHNSITFIIDIPNNKIYNIDMNPLQGEILENQIIIRENQSTKALFNLAEYKIDRLSGNIVGTRIFGLKSNMDMMLIKGTCSKVNNKKF